MKRNQLKKNKIKKSPLVGTQERLSNFQKKSPHKFRQVFEYHQQGHRKLTEGNVGEARGNFEKALSIYPEYIPALNYLAVIFGMLGNFLEANQFIKKVLKLDDRNVLALIQGAIFLFRLGKGKEAESYARKAEISFQEREGLDPYHDYDMLQKMVEMFSVLKLDSDLTKLYYKRKQQLSSISLYRTALALSNEQKYEEAVLVLRSIKSDQALVEKSTYLAKSIELFIEEDLKVPFLYAEEDSGFEQLMTVQRLFDGDEQQKQMSLEYFTNHPSHWIVETSKKLLISSVLEDWLKKAILSNLAELGETEKPVTVRLDGAIQEISLKPIELSLNDEMSEIFRAAKDDLEAGNIQVAIEKFKQIEDVSPMYVPIHVEQATAYIGLKQFEEAKSSINKALEIAPLPSVLFVLSKYYAAVGDYDKAIEQLSRFDTRELESSSLLYDAIELKINLVVKALGNEKAREVLLEEKEKFQFILNDWDHFENRLETLFIAKDVEKPVDGLAVEDIEELLGNRKKDELIAIVKKHNIRGYSKLNKSGLIELIKTEVYEKGLWSDHK